MATTAAAFETGKNKQDLLNWGDKKRFQQLFSAQAVKSYLYLSLGMGAVAFLLPIALVFAGGYRGHFSISFFYHVSDLTRNILVGALWAEGVFLFLFHGLSRLENWLLNVAGIAAISVAMNPVPVGQCAPGPAFTLHAASAIVFFVCLAIVAVALSKGRIKYIIYPPKRRRFARAYELAGVAMIAMPLAVAAIHFFGRRECENHWVFWIESFGIWAFAAYWFVKTAEYKLLLRIKLRPGRRRAAPPRLRSRSAANAKA
jgi:exosortase/archaeosortase